VLLLIAFPSSPQTLPLPPQPRPIWISYWTQCGLGYGNPHQSRSIWISYWTQWSGGGDPPRAGLGSTPKPLLPGEPRWNASMSGGLGEGRWVWGTSGRDSGHKRLSNFEGLGNLRSLDILIAFERFMTESICAPRDCSRLWVVVTLPLGTAQPPCIFDIRTSTTGNHSRCM